MKWDLARFIEYANLLNFLLWMEGGKEHKYVVNNNDELKITKNEVSSMIFSWKNGDKTYYSYSTPGFYGDDWENSDSGTNETNTPGSLAYDDWLPNGVTKKNV